MKLSKHQRLQSIHKLVGEYVCRDQTVALGTTDNTNVAVLVTYKSVHSVLQQSILLF